MKKIPTLKLHEDEGLEGALILYRDECDPELYDAIKLAGANGEPIECENGVQVVWTGFIDARTDREHLIMAMAADAEEVIDWLELGYVDDLFMCAEGARALHTTITNALKFTNDHSSEDVERYQRLLAQTEGMLGELEGLYWAERHRVTEKSRRAVA